MSTERHDRADGNKTRNSTPDGTAIWYFVAATFLFISSPLLVAQNVSVVGIIGTITGIGLMLFGIFVWSKERSRP